MSDDEQFPRGKISLTDEGKTEMMLVVQNGTVILKFSKPMLWIGLGAVEARAMGEALIRKANEIEN